jgi:outer membrane protein assembly factor BamB
MRVIQSLFLLCLAIPTAHGADWPRFRGLADGHAPAAKIPMTWGEKENIVWKTAIHDKGWSSPVFQGNQIWLTTCKEKYADNAPKEQPAKKLPKPEWIELYAVCIDKTTGKILHDIKLRREEQPDYCHSFNSYATPTPTLEPGRAYVHFGSHGTFCIDTEAGKVLWERLDLKCDHWRGPGSSPYLFEDLLILTFDGHDRQYLAAINKQTGKNVWERNKEIAYKTNDGDYKKAYSTPAVLMVQGKPQLVSPSAEATVAVDPRTGAELWRVHHGGMNEAVVPTLGHGLIFLTNGHLQGMIAVKAGGNGKLADDQIAWKMVKGVPTRPSILLHGDHLYMISDNGFASCLDAKTGKQVWNERLGGAYSASPLRIGEMILVCDQDGAFKIFEAKPEFKLLATNKLDAGSMATPAVDDDALFIRTKTHLYRVGKK